MKNFFIKKILGVSGLMWICLIKCINQQDFVIISYQMICNDNSLWGVGNSQAIVNNKGKKGTVSGMCTSLAICPCLEYGIKPWQPGSFIPYRYSSQEEQQVAKQQQAARSAYKSSQPLDTSSKLPTIEMTDVFEHAYEFVHTLDSTIQNLIDLFPDVYEGQGYESAAFLKLCTSSVPLIERINTINSKLFGWAHYQLYFEKNTFLMTIDVSQVIPSEYDIKVGNTFAHAVITQYIHNLNIQHISTSLEKNSAQNNEMIANKVALKKALLW